MKGYLTTCDGAQFELPTLLKWEFSYTGEYQIAKSKEGAETLRVTIAGRFTAAPGDIAAVSGTKIGIVGNFRVIECVRRFGESGEACEVTMQRE